MEDVSVKINNKTYLLEIVETPEDRYDGLADSDYLDNNEGMLFVFNEDSSQPMVMRGMEFPIDIIHIDSEGMVNSVVTAQLEDTEEFEGESNSRYVIEIAAGEAASTGIVVGTIVNLPASFFTYIADKYSVGMARHGAEAQGLGNGKKYSVKTTDIPEKPGKLQVLDHDGKVISNIELGARIFSREDTRALIKIASGGKTPETMRLLGKMMVEMIPKQDTQPAEYST